MKKLFRILFLAYCLTFSSKSIAQTYFPPLNGETWDTISPESIGWCQDSIDVLYDYLEISQTDAFIVLKNGKIVLEKYFGTFTQDSLHVWNSAGKTLTAYAVGIAQTEGDLSINDLTNQYLGNAWTSCTPTQENLITIKNQLSMTSGLYDIGANADCTLPSCLTYVADAGTRWAYHNAAYTLLDSVIESATGQTLNQYVYAKISSKIGLSGLFYPFGYKNIYISKARGMARFGLLLSQNGLWNGQTVQSDLNYLSELSNSSQNINPSYGYLTWLNGKSSYKVPGSQFSFPGPLFPNAPADLYAALGKDAQIINVVPSQDLVVIRMGQSPNNALVQIPYNDTVWQYINRLSCNLSVEDLRLEKLTIYPNPSEGTFFFNGILPEDKIVITDVFGRIISNYTGENTSLSVSSGTYIIRIQSKSGKEVQRKVVVE